MTKKMSKRKPPKHRNYVTQGMIENPRPAGPHHTREQDLERGSSRKHKHKNEVPEVIEEE